ncbi:dihydrofolate reductase [Schaalia canis]|uniref:dihydrofolate reductase n=1 Tax=Schaalia canis TaxID=100469 RepID=A0A3P1SE44_9ACTO|nr:dihydrofolate reductase [Schaalia canis]
MIVASIWAQDRTGVLGTGTDMCWHVPADFAHFKRTTMGAPIIMGRASWESLGGALPGRLNIVITRSRDYVAEGAQVVHSLGEALTVATQRAAADGVDVVWVTGGGTVYAEAMEIVDELVVTDLDLDVAADLPADAPLVRAPLIDTSVWRPDPERSDADWREVSGDARWKVTTWVRG